LILFGGGANNSYNFDRIDIFDSVSGEWTTTSLSQARSGLVAASVNNVVLFAGGFIGDGTGADYQSGYLHLY
jgi:hypothetical protein